MPHSHARLKQHSHDMASEPMPTSLEPFVAELERSVLRVIESNFSAVSDKSEGTFWAHIFKNIATPVSLAINECRGPRHFHYHYKHSKEDDSVLQPVLEPRADMLAQVCQNALKECDKKLVGLHDAYLIKKQSMLESALRGFVYAYEQELENA